MSADRVCDRRAPVSVPGHAGEAWELTRRLSPRHVVRVAVRDAYGEVANCYPAVRSLDDVPPLEPWAVMLADDAGDYRLLCFDLDAGHSRDAEADAGRLCEMLTRIGIGQVVCASGPTGGRHAWLALADPIPAARVAVLARAASMTFGSLDIAPLCNPATGCVRPPGAPHRLGGSSSVVAGDVRCLLAPTTTARQLEALLGDLSASPPNRPARDRDEPSGVRSDGDGRPWLPGVRRPLPARAAQAAGLDPVAADADCSQVLASVLVGAARSHWRFAEVVAELAGSPGLEHMRTVRDGIDRRPRHERDQLAVLSRQWDRCVGYAATTLPTAGADPTFEARAAGLSVLVESVQVRADACPGRWSLGAGGGDRRVLDALCMLTLAGMRPAVQADIRRLALLCGIGRETARTALHRLSATGWIRHASPSTGRHAAS